MPHPWRNSDVVKLVPVFNEVVTLDLLFDYGQYRIVYRILHEYRFEISLNDFSFRPSEDIRPFGLAGITSAVAQHQVILLAAHPLGSLPLGQVLTTQAYHDYVYTFRWP